MSEDDRLYLQFLQNNIARMNTNSVQAKGWCIAIVAALFAIFADTNNLLFVYISFMPIIVFCFLDTSYLLQEHKFIAMYNSFIKGSDEKPDVYTMPMKSFERGFRSFLKALKSWSILPVYGLLLLLGLFICIKFREPVKDKKTELPLKQETVIQDASENIVPEMILKPLE